ncbi:MAG: phosphatase PAP2 family protein, partial [Wenzhouxiangella sp.]
GLTVSLQLVVTGMIGLSTYKWLKTRTVRQRPFAAHPDILCGTAPLDQYSFPSGHTLHAVLFTTLTLSTFPALAPILLPFMGLVALSRVILGLHYPSDVAAGAAIGWLIAQTGLWLFSFPWG